MRAKLTKENQITLPKIIIDSIGPVEYFEVETRDGQILLTPIPIPRADVVRAKLAEMDLEEKDIADAIARTRLNNSI